MPATRLMLLHIENARRRRLAFSMWRLLKSLPQHGPRGPYTQLNSTVPIIRQFLDDTVDLRPNLRLSHRSLAALTAAINLSVTRGWPKGIEVLLFVFWLAHAASYRVVAAACNIPKSTVHDIAHRVTEAVVGILGRTIRLPDPDQLEDIAAGFSRLGGNPALRSVVGAIDGCHVRMKPPAAHQLDFLNHKLFHSIQLQAICDHQGRFIDLFVGFPGSVHDPRVLWNSPVYNRQLYPPEGWCILGDGGHPCLGAPIWLLMPVANPVQARFNTIHGKVRNNIERAFRMVKARWQSIFLRALEVKPAFASEVVTCCAILHNICMENGDLFEAEPPPEEDGPPPCSDVASGENLRD
ncbi:putative nuclease HARBI1 isoform X1 [Xyrichtys novacula]|uniref:Nuclease HARBI1 isoform X1 n=1 Tax=Xyrichtys novacula TaxID=13765 RepID=A0AAV1H6Z2_XYRNO|nr:putative nuclease HARBI1 isoform X1 [Xyrichtys novacula]